jgi:hypothetical protein
VIQPAAEVGKCRLSAPVNDNGVLFRTFILFAQLTLRFEEHILEKFGMGSETHGIYFKTLPCSLLLIFDLDKSKIKISNNIQKDKDRSLTLKTTVKTSRLKSGWYSKGPGLGHMTWL